MPSTTSADDLPTSGDTTDRLTGLAGRTSLMALDAALRTLPRDGVKGLVGLTGPSAAAEVAEVARQMLQATHDFHAAMHGVAE